MLNKILKGLAPLAALAGAVMVSGCDGVNIQIGDEEGVPLAELDMSGDAPTEIVLAGPDKVIVRDGSELDIDVTGDDEAVDALRFSIDDGTLAITREKNSWKDKGTATVTVTLPEVNEVVLAGSGDIEIEKMTRRAEVTIAGSGRAKVAELSAENFDMTIAGAGDFEAAGAVDRLDMTIAGSGRARMAGLKVERADISVAGSGDAEFSSDGKVEASIVGSGRVTVLGRADCTVSAVGSGKLNCKPARGGDDAGDAKGEETEE
ncbi:MAG: head GIN domain-containing protein [Erythrobacter sp.]